MQNMAPGPYTIRVSRAGYLPWQKALDIRAEQVTFANAIHLWTNSATSLVQTGTFTRLTANADGDTLATLDASSTQLLFLTPDHRTISRVNIPESPSIAQDPIRWSGNGTALIMGGATPGESAWWTTSETGTKEAGILPPGQFFWNSNELVGYDAERQYTLNTRTNALSSELLAESHIGAIAGLTLETNTSTGLLMLRSQSILRQVFQLPRGHWQFAGQQGAYTLLKDEDHWLTVRIRVDGNTAEEVTGDWPRWLQNANTPTALFLNQNEIWTQELGQQPVLIARQSEPFVQVAWHPDGQTIFVATKTDVYALELDDRNGRQQTPLAKFDKIYDMAYANGSIFVNAELNGARGMYQRIVE